MAAGTTCISEQSLELDGCFVIEKAVEQIGGLAFCRLIGKSFAPRQRKLKYRRFQTFENPEDYRMSKVQRLDEDFFNEDG